MFDDYGCVAQLVEQLTLNQWVWGSNPHAPTIIKTAFRANERSFFCDVGSNPRVRSCSVSFAFAQQLRFGHRKFNGAVQTLSVRRRNISVSIDGKQFSGLFSCLRPHAPTIIKTAFRANERSFFCDVGSNPRVRSCSVSFAFAQQLRFGHRKFNGAVQTLSVRRRNISVSIDGKQFSGLFSCLRPHAPTIMKTAFRADERSFFGVVYSVCRSDMLLSNETITMFSIKIAWLILKSKPFSNPCGCPRLKRASSLSIIS